MKKTKVTFDVDKLEYSVQVTRALAHPLRIKLLEFIDNKGQINVDKIYKNFKLPVSLTSQHLRILRRAGVVNASKEGKMVIYRINYVLVQRVVISVNNFLGKSNNTTDPLDEYYYETLEALINQGKYDELEQFGNDLISKNKDIDPEINSIINDSFWDLI